MIFCTRRSKYGARNLQVLFPKITGKKYIINDASTQRNNIPKIVLYL